MFRNLKKQKKFTIGKESQKQIFLVVLVLFLPFTPLYLQTYK